MRQISPLIVSALMLGISGVHAQQETSSLFDPPATVGMLDLAKTPLFVDILQRLGLSLRDHAMEVAFTTQFDGLRDMMQKEIAGSKMGYLVSVEEYTDEFGTPIVPAGQLVFAMGKGTEPIDALAESIRKPRLRTPRPPSYASNQSYYIWVKERDGKLAGSMIPRELTAALERSAREEADRRDLMGAWIAALPPDGIASIQRAEYWSDVVTRYAAFLDSQARKERIAQMTRTFSDAQKSFNETYKRYQETVAEMQRVQAYNATLGAIANVSGLVSTSIASGGLTSSSDPTKSVKTTGDPREDLRATIDYAETQFNRLTGERREVKARIELQGNQLQRLDSQLRTEYQVGNVSIPSSDPVLVLPSLP